MAWKATDRSETVQVCKVNSFSIKRWELEANESSVTGDSDRFIDVKGK